MGNIAIQLKQIHDQIDTYPCTLVAISKTKPVSLLQEAYNAGQRDFGENKVQEMTEKQALLPPDIRWHMVGHLQRNKVKQLAPYVHLIHSIDSLKLLQEVNKEAAKCQRVIHCLLQVHIAKEETKFGFGLDEIEDLLTSVPFQSLKNVQIEGLMGMATFTDNQEQIRREFTSLRLLFDQLKQKQLPANTQLTSLSMGMSGDYLLALECGSNMIRVGSAIFGERHYA